MATQWLRLKRYFVGAVAVSSIAATAHAQGLSRGFIVTGTVADPGGTPIPDADISVLAGDSARQTVRSDAKGNFRLDDIAVAPVILRVRRLGFGDKRMTVDKVVPAKPTSVFVTLEPTVAILAATQVNEDEMEDVRLAEFRDRQRSNKFGHFFDEKSLEKARVVYLSEMLRNVPGMTLRASSHVGNDVRVRACTVNTPTHTGPLIFLDGVRMPGSELDETARLSDVVGMEVYTSTAGIPPAYFDRSASCGTILIWTKNR